MINIFHFLFSQILALMSTKRFKAIEYVLQRAVKEVNPISKKPSEYFASQVFNDATMKAALSTNVYQRLRDAIENGIGIENDIADAVATAMKAWAISKGATHFTHWFQPLSGVTAEKHEAFFGLDDYGNIIEKFKGSELAQQEPDASSFPSGGLRTTFEARGYTAWDPSSPAFILDIEGNKTMCIPTIFVSYTGEALDYKTPLLKALNTLDKAATDVCEIFNKDVKRVSATLGPEQEYFLIDKAFFYARPDLLMTGRTLFGKALEEGQTVIDHYFGAIPARAHAFMVDFEQEALKLGIPVQTRHNEVAPSQFECATIFEEANLAVDHNVLLMDVMERIADKHHLKVLFHEKPFAQLNGSGKHANWSLALEGNKNLLAPSSKAKENLQFLTFFICTIKAVHDYADLLRASFASSGNEYRLGEHEAPPPVISIFIGSELYAVLEELEKKSTIRFKKGDNIYMKLGINKIPPIILDNTDRNRTSPFAFTGNKFELRAVGASDNCASAMTILNALVAHQLIQFKKAFDKQAPKVEKKEVAIIRILREYIKEAKNILFEGDNYGEAWQEEAKQRGLSSIHSTPQALDAYIQEKNIALFTQHGIMSERELKARYFILLSNYSKQIHGESQTLETCVLDDVIPVAITYQNHLIQNVKGLKELGLEEEAYSFALHLIQELSNHIRRLHELIQAMKLARQEAAQIKDEREKAEAYENQVKKYLETIRTLIDTLEEKIDDTFWPFLKYRELLLIK